MKRLKMAYKRLKKMNNESVDSLLALLLVIAIILTFVFEYI